jgi:SAM-dependent methyltransferase
MAQEQQQTAPPYRLNVGAGHSYIPGLVNVDISERADVTLDLSTDRLPFEDDSVELVYSMHTLEHIPDYLFALGELYRVLRHDGVMLLRLPYATLTEYHLVNPYHLHDFSEHSFDFFDPDRLKGSAAEEGAVDISLRRLFVRFNYMGAFGLAPAPLRVWARRHLFNVVSQFDIGLVAIKDPARPIDVGPERAAAMERELGRLTAARRHYPNLNGNVPNAPATPGPHGRLRRLERRIALRWGVRNR